jgi:hypothetical protein
MENPGGDTGVFCFDYGEVQVKAASAVRASSGSQEEDYADDP